MKPVLIKLQIVIAGKTDTLMWMMSEFGGTVLRYVCQLAVLDGVLARWIFKPLALRNLKRGESLKVSQSQQRKFVSSCSKLTLYCLVLVFGVRCMLDQWDWFLDPSSYHDPYPLGIIPSSVGLLYSVEIAHYLYSLLVIFWDPPMKDFWVMVAHHLFTLSLLTSSYRFGATKYGTAIMLLHDVADPFMELAKICLYSGYELAANVSFGVFAVVFIYLRDYVYPRHIIWNTHWLLKQNNYAFRVPTMSFLISLWFLHLFWTVLIFKVAAKALQGEGADVREED